VVAGDRWPPVAFAAVRTDTRDSDGRLVMVEADPATDDDERAATDAGLVLVREVLQLRRPLPADPPPPLELRPFRPGPDDAAFLEVNNRAFRWHPDQSDWTVDDLRRHEAEPWFDADAFLLHERDGRLAGFCWTKVHPATADDPALGEIYVIATDPDFSGMGLGRALTLAGLDHLAREGLEVGMLHVEGDNVAARALYDKLGFTFHRAHRWWAPEGTPPPVA
jgi:mycothiol synthase